MRRAFGWPRREGTGHDADSTAMRSECTCTDTIFASSTKSAATLQDVAHHRTCLERHKDAAEPLRDLPKQLLHLHLRRAGELRSSKWIVSVYEKRGNVSVTLP